MPFQLFVAPFHHLHHHHWTLPFQRHTRKPRAMPFRSREEWHVYPSVPFSTLLGTPDNRKNTPNHSYCFKTPRVDRVVSTLSIRRSLSLLDSYPVSVIEDRRSLWTRPWLQSNLCLPFGVFLKDECSQCIVFQSLLPSRRNILLCIAYIQHPRIVSA